MRGDQSIDSKTLPASQPILPSDSLLRRVPGYGLWTTRDGMNLDRGSENPPNPRSLVCLDVACLWIKDHTLATRQPFRGHDTPDRMSVAGTSQTIKARGIAAACSQQPKNWSRYERPARVPGVFRFSVHLCDRTASPTKNGWDDQDACHAKTINSASTKHQANQGLSFSAQIRTLLSTPCSRVQSDTCPTHHEAAPFFPRALT